MNALINIMSSLLSLVFFVGIVHFFMSTGTGSLNPALPKFGKGKKAKGGGDATVDWTRRQVYNAGKTTGRLVWNLAKRPFR